VTAARQAELVEAAALLQATHPTAAAVLARAATEVAAEADDADWRALRKRLLIAAGRRHFPLTPRTTRARLLAAAWWAWRPGDLALPDSLDEVFQRLHDAGCRPLAARRLVDVLDEALPD
jgi:hypothetical protein